MYYRLSDGLLTVSDVMMEILPVGTNNVEIGFVQNYATRVLIRGLREYFDSTVRRVQLNALPLLHSDLCRTCLSLHKSLAEGKLLSIVGDNQYRIILLHGYSQTCC